MVQGLVCAEDGEHPLCLEGQVSHTDQTASEMTLCDPSLAAALLGFSTRTLMRGVRTFGLRFESLALRDLEIERWRLCAAVNGTKGLMLGIVAKPEMAAQFTGWDLLGGFAWARMLSRRPELADRCDRAACAPRPPYQC